MPSGVGVQVPPSLPKNNSMKVNKDIICYKVFVRGNKRRWHSPYFPTLDKIKKGTVLKSIPQWVGYACGPGVSVWKGSQGTKRCASRQLLREDWHEICIWRCIIPKGAKVINDPKWNRCRASKVRLEKKLVVVERGTREKVTATLAKLKLKKL